MQYQLYGAQPLSSECVIREFLIFATAPLLNFLEFCMNLLVFGQSWILSGLYSGVRGDLWGPMISSSACGRVRMVFLLIHMSSVLSAGG